MKQTSRPTRPAATDDGPTRSAPRAARKPPREPTEAVLHEAALTHLARYAATRAGLLRVLDRRIGRWAMLTGAAPEAAAEHRAAARRVVARLSESGAVNDQLFAESRARSLVRAGKSSRAIGAHLAAKGVAAALASASLPDSPEAELAAACIHARKRRLGPWQRVPATPELTRRALGSLARAGFSHEVARRVLEMSDEAAEELIRSFRAAL